MLKYAALLAVFLSFPAPAAVGPMTAGERQRLVAHFEMTEAWLEDFRGRALEGGYQDLYQWFLMISTHSQRHILQVREIKAHPRYQR